MPVAQWIEHLPSKQVAQVRFLPGTITGNRDGPVGGHDALHEPSNHSDSAAHGPRERHQMPLTFGTRQHRFRRYDRDVDAILDQLPVKMVDDTSGWHLVLLHERVLGQGHTRVGARRQAADRVAMFTLEAVRKGEW